MLIDLLKLETSLSNYFCIECSENNISLQVDRGIPQDNLLIIKVDKFYSHFHNPDASPDCLIIHKCQDSTYNIYIVELKNILNQHGFTIENVVRKFITCLDDFMSNRFGHIFHRYEDFTYNHIKLYFITDPYGFLNTPEKAVKMRGHKLDSLLSQRIPKYFGKHLYIEHKLPNPTIKPC